MELSKSLLTVFVLFFVSEQTSAQLARTQRLKLNVIRNINNREPELVEVANKIWSYAEPPLAEIKSAGLLKDVLRENGFVISDELCGFKTVFLATYGTEGPVIGLFGEYDSDLNAFNEVAPYRSTKFPESFGHGGHHNLLAAGSLGAALALADLIRKGSLKCTIRYYGTSDEGGIGTKSYLAGDGYFDDLDISIYWHPSPVTAAATSPWDARFKIQAVFTGTSVNVLREFSTDNTLTATERFVRVLAQLRAGMSPMERLNYEISMNGEDQVIGDSVRFDIIVQTVHQEEAIKLLSALKKSVTQISAEVAVKGMLRVLDAKHQFLPNVTAMRAVYSNMNALDPEKYSAEDQQFVKDLQQHLGKESSGIAYQLLPFIDHSQRETLYGYVSDIGDASWIAPEIYFVVQTLPSVPMHQWPATIFSAHNIGHRGMLRAAKIIAMTVVDFVENKELRQAITFEFNNHAGQYNYSFLRSADLH
ncbi:hypothetical protein WBG78_25910 [Chryseolinea sp. T2]|uniref:hypothetical protein n=1 Tax=Chryseolinea sp. T2 TaxID=3129255 RepID=UPI003076D503